MAASTPVVADTHAFVWYVQRDPKLSPTALSVLRSAAQAGEPIFLSAASAMELLYLVDKGKIASADYRLYMVVLESPTGITEVSPVDLGVVRAAESFPRALLPDPFDRMIAATAGVLGIPLVTADRKMRNLPMVKTIW